MVAALPICSGPYPAALVAEAPTGAHTPSPEPVLENTDATPPATITTRMTGRRNTTAAAAASLVRTDMGAHLHSWVRDRSGGSGWGSRAAGSASVAGADAPPQRP